MSLVTKRYFAVMFVWIVSGCGSRRDNGFSAPIHRHTANDVTAVEVGADCYAIGSVSAGSVVYSTTCRGGALLESETLAQGSIMDVVFVNHDLVVLVQSGDGTYMLDALVRAGMVLKTSLPDVESWSSPTLLANGLRTDIIWRTKNELLCRQKAYIRGQHDAAQPYSWSLEDIECVAGEHWLLGGESMSIVVDIGRLNLSIPQAYGVESVELEVGVGDCSVVVDGPEVHSACVREGELVFSRHSLQGETLETTTLVDGEILSKDGEPGFAVRSGQMLAGHPMSSCHSYQLPRSHSIAAIDFSGSTCPAFLIADARGRTYLIDLGPPTALAFAIQDWRQVCIEGPDCPDRPTE